MSQPWHAGPSTAGSLGPAAGALTSHGLSAEFLAAGSPSFSEFLTRVAPSLLPPSRVDSSLPELRRHGTSIIAVKYSTGVILAADRRPTLGSHLTQADVDRVLGCDDTSAIGVAGAPGLASELIGLFEAEVEHAEKVTERPLSLDGRAERLSVLVRTNSTVVAHGLAVSPILAGWDRGAHRGRIFCYDGTGGGFEEDSFGCIGVGSLFARTFLATTHVGELDRSDAVKVTLRALSEATGQDPASNLSRAVRPAMCLVDASGVRSVEAAQVARWAKDLVDDRTRTDAS